MTYEEAVKDMAEESSDDGTDGDDVVSMQGDVIEGETVFLGTYEQDADEKAARRAEQAVEPGHGHRLCRGTDAVPDSRLVCTCFL